MYIQLLNSSIKGMDVEVITLTVQLVSCVVDMVDAIVDIVQTGSTLTANGLVEKKYISEINAKLITNKNHIFKQSSEIETNQAVGSVY